MKILLEKKVLILKYTWKIARNASDCKINYFIRLYDQDNVSASGEIAFNVRYGESEERIEKEFIEIQHFINGKNSLTIAELMTFFESQKFSHSLMFGVESALTKLLADKAKQSIFEFLSIPKAPTIISSYSIPILPVSELSNFLLPLSRFQSIKLKVNRESAIDLCDRYFSLTNQILRIDGNETWTDVEELIRFCERYKKQAIEFLEQPLPAYMKDEYRYLKKNCPFEIIADESVENDSNLEDIVDQCHGINIKLMKSGSYTTAIKQIYEAKKLGLKIMIGCMVETSMGISSAMHLASLADYLDLDGFLILAEDPFRLCYEENGEWKFNDL